MEEQKNYLCIEYKNHQTNQYGKCYVSFDEEQKLNYEALKLYTLKEIDDFLKNHSKEEILNQMRKDNIFYFLHENAKDTFFDLSIRFYQNGKERSIAPLSQECLQFSVEEFIRNDLNDINKKTIYNNLGGYLNNPNIGDKMKKWIKSLRLEDSDFLIKEYYEMPYLEQRKIKFIIFQLLSKCPKEEKEELPFIRKKIQKQSAA